VVTIDGNAWFVAWDVCEALGYPRASNGMVTGKLDDSEKLINRIDGFSWKVMLVSESGLYKLLMRLDKKEAKGFQDWVTKVVLPAIHKDGADVMESLSSGCHLPE
jgi:prophage antirepressor-like protein